MKKILFLGGSPFQLPPIQYAKQQGHYIITCDYLPANPGHLLADEYHNISTTDKDAIFALAANKNIDGIVAFASDPAAPVAAYVAEKLNLFGNPYESVEILSRKDKYRNFLAKHHFHVPQFIVCSSLDEVKEGFNLLNKPVVIKPVDSSGSKGVSKVNDGNLITSAYQSALSFSRAGKVILEEFIERQGTQIAGDGFVVDGQLVFRCFAQEHFNIIGNVHVPVGESFPLLLDPLIHNQLHKEIQRLLELLNIRGGALNFDIIINLKNEVFLMEVGPRSGGNLISEVIKYSTGINLAKYVVDIALSYNCNDLQMYKHAGFYSCYIIHSHKDGHFLNVEFSSDILNNIVEYKLFVNEGDIIHSYQHSGCGIGVLILKFLRADEMIFKMNKMNEYVDIKLAHS